MIYGNSILRIKITIAVAFYISFHLHAQPWDPLNPPQFQHISVNDGLSDSHISSIVQDHKGFMWFGTHDGLNRYDGFEFKIFKHDPKDSTSIPSDFIQSLTLLKDSSLWVGTNNGMVGKFDRSSNTFTAYKIYPADKGPVYVTDIYEHSNGLLYIGTTSGLFVFDRKNNRVNEFNFTEIEDPSSKRVRAIYADEFENLFVGTEYSPGGLFFLDLENNRSYQFTSSSPLTGKEIPLSVFYIHQNKQHQILLSTGNGLYEFESEEFYKKNKDAQLKYNCSFEEFTSAVKIGQPAYYILEADNHPDIWIGTNYLPGLQYYLHDQDSILNLDFQRNISEKIMAISVFSIFRDQAGVLWVGTGGVGIYKYAPSLQQLGHLNRNSNELYTLNSKIIHAIYQDSKERLWIGGYGGLNIIDLKTGKSRFFNIAEVGKYNVNKRFIHVMFIYEDKFEGKDVYWIGTEGDGLYKYNYKYDKVEKHYYPNKINNKSLIKIPHDINSHTVFSMLRDSKRDLWIGTAMGLEKFDTVQGAFIKIPIPKILCDASQIQILNILEPQNNDNILWISTSHCGLFIYNKRDDRFVKFSPNADLLGIIGPNVNTILEDQQQRLWVGTNGGICQLDISSFDYENLSDLSGIEFKTYTTENGLPNDHVNGILEDNQGNIWISSHRGLTMLNPKTDEIKNFDASDGIQGLEFNPGAYSKSSDGKLYFGGKNGINYFYPDKIEYNTNAPEIALTELKVLNQSYPVIDSEGNVTDINEVEYIAIAHNKNIIKFSFAALEFSAPEKNQYAYKMEGFNEDWVYCGNNREAVYTNLDPGSYTFKVKASNNDRIWNEEGKSILLTIKPPWWRTNWAYVLWMLCLIVILYFIDKIQSNRVRMHEQVKQKELQVSKMQELDQLKSDFFTNISHEFRTPLTLILNPVKSALEKNNNKEVAKELGLVERNALKLVKMVNQLLDLTKLESGKMIKSSKIGDLGKTVKVVGASFDSLATNKSIKFNKILAVNQLVTKYNEDQLEKIINNVLSNAFKFTEKNGKITLILDLLDEENEIISPESIIQDGIKFIKLTVRDTGIGISKSALPHVFDRFYQAESSSTTKYEGTGIGLALVKELVELHKGSIEVKSEPGWGTEVVILLPLSTVYDVTKASEAIPESIESSQTHNREITHDAPATSKPDLLNAKYVVQVVEDNKDLREHIRDILSGMYQIVESKDGEEGLAVAIEHIPDLIISDVMMPKMDGIALANKLKEDVRTSHIPIILLTAKSSKDDKLLGLKAGVDEYLGKPFDADELKIRIENLIEIRRNLQQQFGNGVAEIASKGPSREEEFFAKAKGVVDDNLDNDQFSVEDLAGELNMSRVQFHRKIKALTDQSTTTFIRNIRLEKAKDLLQTGSYNVTEVAYMVGFSSQSYFTKSFQKNFGKAPSAYQG